MLDGDNRSDITAIAVIKLIATSYRICRAQTFLNQIVIKKTNDRDTLSDRGIGK